MTGNPRRGKFPLKLLWSENADLKLSASNGVKDDNKKPAEQRKHRSAQQRQRRQQKTERRGYSDHKRVQRHRQNTTITLPTKPMKRGNTDCRRFKKMPPIEFATKAKLHFSPVLPSLIFYGPPPSFARFCDPRISS